MDNENPNEYFYAPHFNTDESPNEQPGKDNTDNSHIDDLTLELFMNKTMYKRYIQRTNSEKHEENQTFYMKLNKYKSGILRLTHDLVENPDTQITTDVNNIFQTYVKELIRYFEMKEIEAPSKKADDDMMFDPVAMGNEELERPSASYWGKERVIRSGYPMNAFPRARK